MKALFFAGSLRKGSYNQHYVEAAANLAKKVGDVEAELIRISEYPLPLYNHDIEDKAFPPAVRQLAEKVAAAEAVVISSPENNGSIAAVLKNTVDWLSRPPLNPWPGKFILLLGASTGAFGAIRGLWHSRQPFEALGCYVYPQMLGLAKAHEAFDEGGNLKDPSQLQRLDKLLREFFAHANSFSSI